MNAGVEIVLADIRIETKANAQSLVRHNGTPCAGDCGATRSTGGTTSLHVMRLL